MKKRTEAKNRLLAARHEADAILATGANRLLLIEAILIVCVFAALFVSLRSALALILSVIPQSSPLSPFFSQALSALYLALVIFFAAPVVLGLFRLAERMQAGEEPMLAELFYYLSSRKRYLCGLRTTWLGSLKLIVSIAATDAIGIIWQELTPDTPLFDFLGGVVIALAICFYVIWMLFPYFKLYCLLKQPENAQNKDAYLLSPFGGLRLLCFFLPWILLGFVSIGLLLVLDVIPRMLLTYFCDCARKENSH